MRIISSDVHDNMINMLLYISIFDNCTILLMWSLRW